jgi:hypothetical protein
MDREASRMIIYSCITNGYDEIPDEHYYDPDIQYVMFTDGTVEKKGPWEFREIPCDHPCHRRRSAFVKINPHKVFPKGERTVWLDGCYVMTERYAEQCKNYFEQAPFTIMRHCEKFSYLDEVLEGFMASMNTWDDQILITKTIKELGYNFKQYCSPVLASIWRTMNDEYEEFGDLWWKYSLIGPNRDQISFDTARQLTKMELNIIEDGWISREKQPDGTIKHMPGSCGILFGSRGKQYRRKRHPQAGHPLQYKQRSAILKELRNITGMHQIYARFDFSEFVLRNVVRPTMPLQESNNCNDK